MDWIREECAHIAAHELASGIFVSPRHQSFDFRYIATIVLPTEETDRQCHRYQQNDSDQSFAFNQFEAILALELRYARPSIAWLPASDAFKLGDNLFRW